MEGLLLIAAAILLGVLAIKGGYKLFPMFTNVGTAGTASGIIAAIQKAQGG